MVVLTANNAELLDIHYHSQIKGTNIKSRLKLWTPLLKSASNPNDIGLLVTYIKALTEFCNVNPRWATTALRKNCEYLTALSVKETDQSTLEDVASALRAAFKVTLVDNENEQHKMGRTLECYSMSVFLLALYVHMRAYTLAEGILQATIQYHDNIPPLESSPPQVQTKFLFYKGCLKFFKLDYASAVQCFEQSLDVVQYRIPTVQFEHIMAYLIPAKYLHSHKVPSSAVWEALPKLKELYSPLFLASRQGNWSEFETLLKTRSALLSDSRILLSLEAMSGIVRLNLLHRLWLIKGSPKRLELEDFALSLETAKVIPQGVPALEAAEFYIAQLIADGEVKGYIHDEYKLLLLSSTSAFPNL